MNEGIDASTLYANSSRQRLGAKLVNSEKALTSATTDPSNCDGTQPSRPPPRRWRRLAFRRLGLLGSPTRRQHLHTRRRAPDDSESDPDGFLENDRSIQAGAKMQLCRLAQQLLQPKARMMEGATPELNTGIVMAKVQGRRHELDSRSATQQHAAHGDDAHMCKQSLA